MKKGFAPCLVLLLLATGGCSQRPLEDAAVQGSVVGVAGETEEAQDVDLMRGLFSYMADAAVFRDCANGERYPVAMEADYISAERAYLEVRSEPGAPVLVTFEGRLEPRPPMEGEGMVEMVIIDRFEAAHPGEKCETERRGETGG